MAKKDDIFNSFLKHDLFQSKYGIEEKDLPSTVLEGMNSKIDIFKAMAELVNTCDGSVKENKTDQQTYELLTRLINVSEL